MHQLSHWRSPKHHNPPLLPFEAECSGFNIFIAEWNKWRANECCLLEVSTYLTAYEADFEGLRRGCVFPSHSTPLREDGRLSALPRSVYRVFDVQVAPDINDRFSDVLASCIFLRLTLLTVFGKGQGSGSL